MTPLHLAVESNRIKMVECLLDHGADIDLQDDTEVILHTNAVDYFKLAGRYCIHCSLIFLCSLNIRFSVFKLSELGSDL